MNEDVKDTFVKRSQILVQSAVFLMTWALWRSETPVLVQNAGGAAARPFMTHFNALDEDINLRISLELYLKRLIVGGMEGVYESAEYFVIKVQIQDTTLSLH